MLASVTPSPSDAGDAAVHVTWVDEWTFYVVLATLVATVVLAIMDYVIRQRLAARVDFHPRFSDAVKLALSKRKSEQDVGVAQLTALTRSKWATKEDKELALTVMEELDRD